MGQFSMKIIPSTGSRLDGNQHVKARTKAEAEDKACEQIEAEHEYDVEISSVEVKE